MKRTLLIGISAFALLFAAACNDPVGFGPPVDPGNIIDDPDDILDPEDGDNEDDGEEGEEPGDEPGDAPSLPPVDESATNPLPPDFMQLVTVPGGTFMLGQSLSGGGNIPNMHQVTLTTFRIGRYPVTQQQFNEVMGGNPSFATLAERSLQFGETDALQRPVERVRWYDAIVFANRLSMRTAGVDPAYELPNQWPDPTEWSSNPADWGQIPTSNNARWNAVRVRPGSNGYRLPTEAQWEFAAKAGGSAGAFRFSGSNVLADVGWTRSNSGSNAVGRGPRQVGLLTANALGIHDMSGNLWEWVWDWFVQYTDEAKTDPTGGIGTSSRVSRGGSWYETNENLFRNVFRFGANPSTPFANFGFRVARPAP